MLVLCAADSECQHCRKGSGSKDGHFAKQIIWTDPSLQVHVMCWDNAACDVCDPVVYFRKRILEHNEKKDGTLVRARVYDFLIKKNTHLHLRQRLVIVWDHTGHFAAVTALSPLCVVRLRNPAVIIPSFPICLAFLPSCASCFFTNLFCRFTAANTDTI